MIPWFQVQGRTGCRGFYPCESMLGLLGGFSGTLNWFSGPDFNPSFWQYGTNLAKHLPNIKPSKYQADVCAKLWTTLKNEGMSFGTLCRWAQQDSSNAYIEAHTNYLRQLIYKSRSSTHYDIAQVVYHLYMNQYATVFINQKQKCLLSI